MQPAFTISQRRDGRSRAAEGDAGSEQQRASGRELAVPAFDGDRGGIPLTGQRLHHLNPDPAKPVLLAQPLRDPFGGGLDELELAGGDDAADRLRNRRVVERAGYVVAGRGPGRIGRHVNAEHQRLLDLALPAIHPDDRGYAQVPDRYGVRHPTDANNGDMTDTAGMVPRTGGQADLSDVGVGTGF